MSAQALTPEPAMTRRPVDIEARAAIDASCSRPVMAFLVSAVAWLLVGTVLAMVASLKMHWPEFLADRSWLAFGRVRPAHLNAVTYGWASMAGIGVVLWMQARLSRVTLSFPRVLTATAILWNLVVAGGIAGILGGYHTSVEWIEFPFPVALSLGVLFAVFAVISFYTFARRRATHVYVTQWYMFGAILWFPYLYLVANVMIHLGQARGVAQASTNWWFAHNVLGLWLTPIGVGAAYYLIPKVIGRPIHSYYLSILGFWSLALFYNWSGTHHLIGGPLPAWLITIGIIGSMMMFVPVITVAINHHLTMVGSFHMLKTSPTLRFVVAGAMMYTAVSVQGSLQSLRTLNEVTHFTHYTVAHAHLGVYGFFTMIMFGCCYYIMPRLTGVEWSSALLIKIHFWSVLIGIALYFAPLTAGGFVQGLMMNDPAIPFIDTVRHTIPYLWVRSGAGVLLSVGHLVFALLVVRMLAEWRRRAGEPEREALLSRAASGEEVATA